MLTINWQCHPFKALHADAVYDMLQLRAAIFVVEQDCAYQDVDGLDRESGVLHLFGRDSQSQALLAYARILPPGLVFTGTAIGRVVIEESCRQQHLGTALMEEAIRTAKTTWPDCGIEISAQCQWQSFYQRLGFEIEGEPYLEDGIPHQHMKLTGA